MAKSFDDLVKRTTTKKTREKAARRVQQLFGELALTGPQKPGKRDEFKH
jgi:hypothetical protein